MSGPNSHPTVLQSGEELRAKMSAISSYMLVLLLCLYFHAQYQAQLYSSLFAGHICLETPSGDVFGSE